MNQVISEDIHAGGRPVWEKEKRLMTAGYSLARYICPICTERYGIPAKDKYMDVKRCSKPGCQEGPCYELRK